MRDEVAYGYTYLSLGSEPTCRFNKPVQRSMLVFSRDQLLLRLETSSALQSCDMYSAKASGRLSAMKYSQSWSLKVKTFLTSWKVAVQPVAK